MPATPRVQFITVSDAIAVTAPDAKLEIYSVSGKLEENWKERYYGAVGGRKR